MTIAPRTVLIVDDHAGFRSSARVLLEAAGHLVVIGEAGNGAEAVDAVTRLRPDIVLLDVVLPDVDGMTVCAMIMRDPTFQPAVILTSSRSPDAYGPRLRAGPARGFIAKADLSAAELIALAG